MSAEKKNPSEFSADLPQEGLPKDLPVPQIPGSVEDDGPEETSAEDLTKLMSMLKLDTNDVVSIKKMGLTSSGTRQYVAVVSDGTNTAYLNFDLEVGGALVVGKQNKAVASVILTARLIGTRPVGKMIPREDIKGTKFKRLNKFGWPICEAGPGGFLHQAWDAHEVSTKVSQYLIKEWTEQGLTMKMTETQLKDFVDSTIVHVPNENIEVFNAIPLGAFK